MKVYRLTNALDAGGPVIEDMPLPEPGPGEVRIRIEAASLNYRDLLVRAAAARAGFEARVPLSDGAGTVDAIGAQVRRWKVGDRVAAAFFRDWITGPFQAGYAASALGSTTRDGVLAECVVLPETALVAIPAHLSFEEAATLPCAAVTAWNGLVARGGMRAGDTLLVQGTGGVALFGLQFAVAMGVEAIVISSSNEKLLRAKALGASVLINYREQPDWDATVMDATAGRGASHILELGGPDTYERSVRAVAVGGTIVQVGVLSGLDPAPHLQQIMWRNANIMGVTVGSVEHFEAMNIFLSTHALRPIIDRVFPVGEVVAALAYMESGQHFGKIVIDLDVSP